MIATLAGFLVDSCDFCDKDAAAGLLGSNFVSGALLLSPKSESLSQEDLN
jgi:hypothetical protein